MSERFFRRVWQGTVPLVVWAAHFFFCYLYAAAGGRRGVLVSATVVAFAVAAWLLWRGMKRHERVALVTAGLALIGIGWGALPLLIG